MLPCSTDDLSIGCSVSKYPEKKWSPTTELCCEVIFFFELTLPVCICLNLIEQLSTSIWQPAHPDNFHFCCVNRSHRSESRGDRGRAGEWQPHRSGNKAVREEWHRRHVARRLQTSVCKLTCENTWEGNADHCGLPRGCSAHQ